MSNGGLRRLHYRLAGSIVRYRVERPAVALTFDDGPHPRHTPEILKVLAAHRARATFFVLGRQVTRHRQIVDQAVAGGHSIANHSWSHVSFPDATVRERLREVRRCHAASSPCGIRVFRPPRSLQTPASFVTVRAAGFSVMTWSVEIEDWIPQSSSTLREKLGSRVFPGAVVLLHDRLESPTHPAAGDRGALVEALDGFLRDAAGEYEFVSLSDIARVGTPVYRPWFVADDGAWTGEGTT
jgi:peptidoglycan/xylan/chitin deacetylase (PgdA/CDA1 family)